MKTKFSSLVIGSVALFFLCQNLMAMQSLINQKGPGLEISSILVYNEKRISDYTLIVYDETQSSDTIVVSKMKTVFLKLSYGHYYSLRYIKAGFLDRIVIIDTKLTGTFQPKETGFDYEITMIPTSNHGNTVSDLPVAVIHYDLSKNKFAYSRNYHRQIRGKEIEEMEFEN